jgi:hypothetical protein
MNVVSGTSRRVAKCEKSSTIASNAASSQSTRSILFTHTTRWGIRSSEAMNAWRRDCSTTPLRASTRTSARSAVDAPVTMLRV